MKKLFLTLFLGAFSLCGFAQSAGEVAVGGNVGVAPYIGKGHGFTNFGLGLKAQYNISDPVRLEAGLDYWATDKQKGVVDFTANIQYLFNIGDSFYLYPTVGIGYGHLNGNAVYSANRFVIDAGVGAEYRCSQKISCGLEIKYQYMKDFQRLPITLGLTYHL